MNSAPLVRLSAAAIALLGLTACDTPPERAPTPPNTPPSPQGAQIIDKPIAWPAAAQLDQDARAALSDAARAAVDQAPVPVLVVARSQWLAKAIVTQGPRFAAVSTRHDGVTVSLHSTARAHRYAHIQPAHSDRRVRGQEAFITQNERIWSAAWIEGGVAYSLELECDRLPDPRCEDEQYLLQLSEALAYVGGRQEVQP